MVSCLNNLKQKIYSFENRSFENLQNCAISFSQRRFQPHWNLNFHIDHHAYKRKKNNWKKESGFYTIVYQFITKGKKRERMESPVAYVCSDNGKAQQKMRKFPYFAMPAKQRWSLALISWILNCPTLVSYAWTGFISFIFWWAKGYRHFCCKHENFPVDQILVYFAYRHFWKRM